MYYLLLWCVFALLFVTFVTVYRLVKFIRYPCRAIPPGLIDVNKRVSMDMSTVAFKMLYENH